MLKLKDWPPQDDFRTLVPEMYTAFMESVPQGLKTFCKHDGVLNMASKMPSWSLPTDIGPKVYAASGQEAEVIY